MSELDQSPQAIQAEDQTAVEQLQQEATLEQETLADEAPVQDTPVINAAPLAVMKSEAKIISVPADAQKEATVVEASDAVKVARQYPVSVSDALKGLFERLETAGGPSAMVGLTQVMEYIDKMRPGVSMSSIEGARNQASLYRAIKLIIEGSGDHFRLSFSALLKLIDENQNGVFGERYIFRFMEDITLKTDEQNAFKRIINLLKVAAPVTNRAANLKTVSFTKSLQYELNDESKQRLLSYFNV